MYSDSKIVARVVHLSDIHFGFTNPNPVWEEVVKFVDGLEPKPSAILITGDIVNNPKKKLFQIAQHELQRFGDIPVLICPGNHDRHWLGNALGSLKPSFTHDFFYFLRAWYHHEAPNFKVLNLGERITARVTAIDSSDKSSYLARSFVDEATCNALEEAMDKEEENGKLNLRIVMTHHHLLPIAALEPKRDNFFSPFFNAMLLTVNAGTVLKTLSKNHVDLVFHGHEHEGNAAKYTTFENRLGNVTIIGAGSSTGTVTGKGWHFDKANFNVLEVCEDDSIWLQTYYGSSEDNSFSPKKCHKLFDGVDLRRARFYLTHDTDESREVQRVKVYFRYMDNRDIIVHRSDVNISPLTNNKYRFYVFSPTGGQPLDPRVWLLDKDGKQIQGDVGEGFKIDTKKTKTWRCEAEFPEQTSQLLHHVSTRYRWKNAGMLSEGHIQELQPEDRGFLSSQFFENVCYKAPSTTIIHEVLEMSVDLPSQWAPDDIAGNVKVFTKTEDQNTPVHSVALTKTIYSNGEGHYALRVDYPDPNTKYFLAWRVRKESREFG